MHDLILFDLDGTLSDPAEGITNSILYALHKVGLDAKKEDLLCFIGPPLVDSYKEHFPSMDPWKGLEDYREYFSVKGLYENELYPDTKETLEKLKEQGYKLAVATSKPELYAVQILEHFGIADLFEGIYGATMDDSRVRKEDVIQYALENLKSENPIMIGDRLHDIEGAHMNHIPAVGVLCGYGSKEELEKADADFIIETLSDLPELLEKAE